MSTEHPQPQVSMGQIWVVSVAGKFDFIGEVSWLGEDSAAFVIHAVLGLNGGCSCEFLGQVIVVPREFHMWRLLVGPR